jgi:hypothetical protein
VGAVLDTMKKMIGFVAVRPDTSQALAASLCGPFVAVTVFQLYV